MSQYRSNVPDASQEISSSQLLARYKDQVSSFFSDFLFFHANCLFLLGIMLHCFFNADLVINSALLIILTSINGIAWTVVQVFKQKMKISKRLIFSGLLFPQLGNLGFIAFGALLIINKQLDMGVSISLLFSSFALGHIANYFLRFFAEIFKCKAASEFKVFLRKATQTPGLMAAFFWKMFIIGQGLIICMKLDRFIDWTWIQAFWLTWVLESMFVGCGFGCASLAFSKIEKLFTRDRQACLESMKTYYGLWAQLFSWSPWPFFFLGPLLW